MNRPDRILADFLRVQTRHALALAAANPDLLGVVPLDHDRFLVHYACRGYCRVPDGQVGLRLGFDVGVTIGPDYLRRVDMGLVTMLTPRVFHPNVLGPVICLGHITPATGLADLLVSIYELLTWRTASLHDCLNQEAAQWGRANPDKIPLEKSRSVRMPRLETPLPEPRLP